MSGLTIFAFIVQGLFFAASPTGGEGFTAQRFMAARNEFHAQVGQLFNTILTLVVRVVPFLFCGLIAAALYAPGTVAEPGELWARLVRAYSPTGLLGLLVAGVFAAYMATISTEMNWAASYIVNDLYRPFLQPRPRASATMCWTGRLSSVILVSSSLSLVVAYLFVQGMRAWFLFINSVVFAFVLPLSWLRFFWWRLNIYGEAAALIVGLPLSYIVWFPLGFSNEARTPLLAGLPAPLRIGHGDHRRALAAHSAREHGDAPCVLRALPSARVLGAGNARTHANRTGHDPPRDLDRPGRLRAWDRLRHLCDPGGDQSARQALGRVRGLRHRGPGQRRMVHAALVAPRRLPRHGRELMKTILAIDGGGTHTECLAFSRHGDLLGAGSGGPSNHLLAPAPVVVQSIRDAIAATLSTAQLPLADVECISAGLAGIDYDGAGSHEASAIFSQAGFPGAILFGDSVIAHRGALNGEPGSLALAGTGSAFLAIAADGRMAKSGGWGPAFGDEGSAYWIAIEGLRAVARASDGRATPTALTAAILAHLDVTNVWDTVQRIYRDGLERHQVAALSEVVGAAAEAGDATAHTILQRAAWELADGAAAAAREAGLSPAGCAVSFQGSLLRRCRPVRQEFLRAVCERLPGCRPRDPLHAPVYGAYLLGCQAAGWDYPTISAPLVKESR